MDLGEDIQRRLQFLKEALDEADENHLIELLCFDDERELSIIKATLKSNAWILPKVCDLGLSEVLPKLQEFQVDLNTRYQEKTGLQYACQRGHSDIVQLLLKCGANLKTSLWDEDSEFYLATFHGHQNVVAILENEQPHLVSDESVRYCLFYAACKGGHIDLMGKWKLPGVDVNKPIELVPHLAKCEYCYPLFAAFEGRHFDVARALILDDHAGITEEICNNFQDFTVQMVHSLWQTSIDPGRQNFEMSDFNIKFVLAACFQPKSAVVFDDDDDDIFYDDDEVTTETAIDLSHNKIESLPNDFIWDIQGLTTLNVAYNPLQIIYDPLNASTLDSNRLATLNLSHCELEHLSEYIFSLPQLSHLDISHNKLTELPETAKGGIEWKCKNLHYLDVSHNLLTSLPFDVQTCRMLEKLAANNNQLQTICSPWQCPMKFLNLSNNKLEEFSPTADQFWKQTLCKLEFQYNQLRELSESIVKMRHLTYLDVSNNEIKQVPPPDSWKCPLMYLMLNNNQLGSSTVEHCTQKSVSQNKTNSSQVEFPGQKLGLTITELYLANNDLTCVPESVCHMVTLSVLDLSGNKKIKHFPNEMGKLQNLLVLKLDGISVEDKELQALISAAETEERYVKVHEIITYLERKRRNCVNSNIIKMVVLGCKNKSGHCIVQKFTSKDKRVENRNHETLTVTQWHSSDGSWWRSSNKKSFQYEIWELPENDITPIIQPCFLTLNSLYLIVHDATSYEDCFDKISEKISSIQACVLGPVILVVLTYVDKKDLKTLDTSITSKAKMAFPEVKFISVVSDGNENADELREEILSVTTAMTDATYQKKRALKDRQIPSVFLDVASRLKDSKEDICRMEQFLQATHCERGDLDDGIDPHLRLHEFLLQIGAMLHYNVQLGELADCVILNPTWLFNILSHFLQSLIEGKNRKKSEVLVQKVRERVEDMLPQGYDYFPAFLKLLESFNIAVRITDVYGTEKLLIPSFLPHRPPQFHADNHKDEFMAARLYFLPAIPSALWSHVISQLIVAFQRFSPTTWQFGQQNSASRSSLENTKSIDRTKSFKMSCKQRSLKGLRIANKYVHTWKTGIMVNHEQGLIVVEEVECRSSTGNLPVRSGILITVKATGSSEGQSEQDTRRANLEKLAAIGIVRDELEEILELFNPKFRDPSEQLVKPYALCPHCHDIVPGSGEIDVTNLHFSVRECAQLMMWNDNVVCENGPTSLEGLVPELLFLELPTEMRLSATDLEQSDVTLGHGLAGKVTKGSYKGTDVAIKIFHTPTVRPISYSTNTLYPNVRYLNSHEELSRADMDKQDTEHAKISTAFSEVRREVGIISKLNHSCIVKFIGVCVRPQLLLVMELAPLGSLRGNLEQRMKDQGLSQQRPSTYESDMAVSQMLFSKHLTFKIIYQIGSGLKYLHENNIIYRDLKPDNILVMSLNEDDAINVKLSDYGISKFVTLQGLTGLFGTIGYMAPEVMSKQMYTEMVDIYSFGIVMVETLTGIPPLERSEVALVSKMIHSEAAPTHIQGIKIQCNFPCLEQLMSECWSPSMNDRPVAQDIVKQMQQDEFLLLHDCIWLQETAENLELTCMYACETAGRWNIWLCESAQKNQRYISVYDIESCSFIVHRKYCQGPRVISMAKSGVEILLASEDYTSLEPIVRGTVNTFDISQPITLEGFPPKTLLSRRVECSGVIGNVVVVGHGAGYITLCWFKHSHSRTREMKRIKLESNKPVSLICSLGTNHIVLACGMDIFFQEILLDSGQEDVVLRRRRSTLRLDTSTCGKVGLRNLVDAYKSVFCMESHGNDVWCSLEGDSYVFRIDSSTKKVSQILFLTWDPTHDSITVEELLARPGASATIEESHTWPSANSEGDIGLNTSQRALHSTSSDQPIDMLNDVFEPDMIKSSTLPASPRGSGHSFDSTISNLEESSNRVENLEDGDEVPLYYEIDPRDVSVDVQMRNDRSGGEEERPPLPPRLTRTPVIKKRVRSMPQLANASPPPLPPRRPSQEKSLIITSLQPSSDILVIGTNCGGCVLLPVTNLSNGTSSTSSSSTLHLPLLRHLAKKVKISGRMRSGSSTSSVAAFMHAKPQNSPGTISKLTMANGRLISFHSPQDTEQSSAYFSDNRGNGLKGDGDNLSVSSGRLAPDSPRPGQRPQSGLIVGGSYSLQVADIAIWDHISWHTLTTNRACHNNIS